MNLESFILFNLIENEDYVRKCLPYIKVEYFHNKPEKLIFRLINDYITKYNKPPSKDALDIELSAISNINEDLHKNSKELLNNLTSDEEHNLDWIVDKTEEFCQDRATHNALLESIDIAENKKESKGKIPEIMQEALAVSFDTNIGHNFLDNWEDRWHFYTDVQHRKPFSLEFFNKVTGGGIPNKTLTVAIAGTGVGKSRWLCHEAAVDLQRGMNVLYITLEMAEYRIAERIDANLLDIDINKLRDLSKEEYKQKIETIKTIGNLIVKEYPTSGASPLNFKHLLNELNLKKNFVPDVIYVDYINICASSRVKRGQSNSYEYIKMIAEELRGLAVEMDLPIITATQTNRSGFASSDLGLEDTAESFGLPHTTDFMFALISTDELNDLNQQLVKQLKNRFGDPTINTRFVIGVDKTKMRYYDCEQVAQADITDGPVMDNTSFDKSKFEGFF